MNISHRAPAPASSRPLTDPELQTLEEGLVSLDPETSMSVEELDGYCTALACCPEPVALEVWLPAVWGDRGAESDDGAIRQALQPLVERHRLAVWDMLEQGGGLAPVLAGDEPDGPFGHAWVIGFLRGMAVHPDVWDALEDDDTVSDALDPLMRLAHEALGPQADADEPFVPIAADERSTVLHDVMDGVQDVYDYFRPARARAMAPPTLRHDQPPVGRNALCPCGSGRKFKRCCAPV